MAELKYNLRYNDTTHSIEITRPNCTTIIYKIPYTQLEKKEIGFEIHNPFIVYILTGKNEEGKYIIYVGKSKNSINFRSLTDRDNKWEYSYILTQFKERSFFNDGTIQFLENAINKKINKISKFENQTLTTTPSSANTDDVANCQDYMIEAYRMLEILGLSFNEEKEEITPESKIYEPSNEKYGIIPNGIYFFKRRIKKLNKTIEATMRVQNGIFTLLKGSEIAEKICPSCSDYTKDLRNNRNIVNGILQVDIQFDSPSSCAQFVIGASVNGWEYWTTSSGTPISSFRD